MKAFIFIAITVSAMIVTLSIAMSSGERAEVAQQTANVAQQTAASAQTTANIAMTRADSAYGLAEKASVTAEAAMAAVQRGDAVAIVGVVIGCAILGLFGFMLFLSWDRSEQRKQELRTMQLRAWLHGRLPQPRTYYDIEADQYSVLELPSGK